MFMFYITNINIYLLLLFLIFASEKQNGKKAMQRSPIENGVIRLNNSRIPTQSKKDKRKVFYDAFLFLLLLNLMGVALVFSFLNNYLFMDRLLAGGFILGAVTLLKALNSKI